MHGGRCRKHQVGLCDLLHPGDRGHIEACMVDCKDGNDCQYYKKGCCAYNHIIWKMKTKGFKSGSRDRDLDKYGPNRDDDRSKKRKAPSDREERTKRNVSISNGPTDKEVLDFVVNLV